MKKRQLVIIGAGGHGQVMAEIAMENGYTKILFLDDARKKDIQVVGKISEFERYISNSDFFVAIGNNDKRESVSMMLMKKNAELVNLIHPNSVISKSVILGKGIAVMAGSVINVGAEIGDGAIINTSASVDHGCVLESYVHISVGAHLAGMVSVGERTFIGAGATVINNIDICADCVIGAGGTVVRSINESGTYVGVPTRRMK